MKTNKISSHALIGTIAVAALVVLTAPAFARGGGVGAGGGMSVGAGVMSSSHVKSQGSLNTNGPTATDRDHGYDRAQDRMSSNGTRHSKAHIGGSATTETGR